ncbi:MAG TPA: SAF domain-containing protein [Caulobacteraceae bacterium]|nr:SAF domain-containing protein [Caulobacteraceae bacterium]
MRARRLINLTIALSIGVAGLGAGRLLQPRSRPGQAEAAEAPTVPVVVANVALAAGDPLTPDRLMVMRLPAGLAPQGAFASIQALEGGQAPPTALTAMAPLEPVLPAMIVGRSPAPA